MGKYNPGWINQPMPAQSPVPTPQETSTLPIFNQVGTAAGNTAGRHENGSIAGGQAARDINNTPDSSQID